VSANQVVEYAVSRTPQNAYRSLAAAANVDIDVVLRHAANNTLSAVVARIRSGEDPVAAAYESLYRRKALWIRQGLE
jgi:hypothetical protein